MINIGASLRLINNKPINPHIINIKEAVKREAASLIGGFKTKVFISQVPIPTTPMLRRTNNAAK